MAETQAQRLTRIEDKIDKITDSVSEITTVTAVMHNRLEDLEQRRVEAYERMNKFSQKQDHVHDCMHAVKAKVNLSSKVIYVVGAAVVTALISEFVTKF